MELEYFGNVFEKAAWESGATSTVRFDPADPKSSGYIVSIETLRKFAEMVVEECGGDVSKLFHEEENFDAKIVAILPVIKQKKKLKVSKKQFSSLVGQFVESKSQIKEEFYCSEADFCFTYLNEFQKFIWENLDLTPK